MYMRLVVVGPDCCRRRCRRRHRRRRQRRRRRRWRLSLKKVLVTI